MLAFFKKYWKALFIGAIGLSCLCALLLLRLPLLPEGMLAEQIHTPPPREPLDAEDILDLSFHMQGESIKGAVTVCLDGRSLLTLPSHAEALRLMNALIEGAKAPEGEMLFSAKFDGEITFQAAAEEEKAQKYEEAQRLLNEKPLLCPVRVITRAAALTPIPYETKEIIDKRLLKGSRLLLCSGREGATLTIIEKSYVSGMLEYEVEKPEITYIEPVNESVAIGGYTSKKPEGEPGRDEGEKGKAAPEGFRLRAPIKGDIISNFGMRENMMHNGLDYKGKAGIELTAPAAGTICFLGERGSYGLVIEIDHGEGFVTRLSPVGEPLVRVGDQVAQGDKLGKLSKQADKERTDHLHMELLIDGIPYNPRFYMK